MSGFADTLYLFRSILEERRKEKKKFNQVILAKDILGVTDSKGAHNAVYDVEILAKLVEKIGVTKELFRKKAKSINNLISVKKMKSTRDLNKPSLQVLKPKVTSNMICKIASVGINLYKLTESYNTGGIEGVKLLLGQDVQGKPLVTKNKKIINNIIDVLKDIKN